MDQYKNIIETRKDCEKITCAPYPKDPGQSLRIQELVLKQQYFFVSATLKDILRRFTKRNGDNWERLPEKVSLFLLDVQHSVGILEMLRILIDEY
jgi:glycogen phosphorylase